MHLPLSDDEVEERFNRTWAWVEETLFASAAAMLAAAAETAGALEVLGQELTASVEAEVSQLSPYEREFYEHSIAAGHLPFDVLEEIHENRENRP